MINEPAQKKEKPSSYIDLIFTLLPILAIDSKAHPLLRPNCHNKIVFEKFNLEIYHFIQFYRES